MNLIFKDPSYYKRLVRAASEKGLIRPMTEAELKERYINAGIIFSPETNPKERWITAIEAGMIAGREAENIHRYRRMGRLKYYKPTDRGGFLYALSEIKELAEWLKTQPRRGKKGEK